ncbi:MAG: hypothetical protein NW203_13200, partial [Hyphomonadaceae bacterium]|nr:hypothetical protein [Hyphomonadaceae bacterium]
MNVQAFLASVASYLTAHRNVVLAAAVAAVSGLWAGAVLGGVAAGGGARPLAASVQAAGGPAAQRSA